MNLKGGVGKTTTAVHLAAGLAGLGSRVRAATTRGAAAAPCVERFSRLDRERP